MCGHMHDTAPIWRSEGNVVLSFTQLGPRAQKKMSLFTSSIGNPKCVLPIDKVSINHPSSGYKSLYHSPFKTSTLNSTCHEEKDLTMCPVPNKSLDDRVGHEWGPPHGKPLFLTIFFTGHSLSHVLPAHPFPLLKGLCPFSKHPSWGYTKTSAAILSEWWDYSSLSSSPSK